ncbi:MAG TPA: DUF1214 domain-containing protein [Mycobacterium sp.]|nr:DUF1214 domain-containing protein [Mycobacterium sp.]HQC76203.1 DUF1214 domain-containing protein [Mycobacterium sp.]
MSISPVDAFWSVTTYDAQDYPVANEINRFDISDRDPLQYNADGSLDLCLQQANPGPDKLYVLACICAHILDAYRNQ